MPLMAKLGTLSPVIFFVNHRDPAHEPGYILLAPHSDFATPEGYSREYADTLSAVDRLQSRLQEQEARLWQQEADASLAVGAERREAIADSLRQRMCSSSTSAYEREFIRLYLQLREEKRQKHQQRFLERNAFLYAREFDLGDRKSDTEEVRLDKLTVTR